MGPRGWIVCGALLGGLGVALGAFGAHGLPAYLEAAGHPPEEVARRMNNFHTAARYQMYHAPALLLVGLLLARKSRKMLHAAGWMLLIGTVIFSGLLYVLALAGPQWRWLGAVVPIGGLMMIGGWTALAVGGSQATDA